MITPRTQMPSSLLLYGVTGYTGRLILAECLEQGLRPILSGRDAVTVGALAAEHGLESRPASLNDTTALDRAMKLSLIHI